MEAPRKKEKTSSGRSSAAASPRQVVFESHPRRGIPSSFSFSAIIRSPVVRESARSRLLRSSSTPLAAAPPPGRGRSSLNYCHKTDPRARFYTGHLRGEMPGMPCLLSIEHRSSTSPGDRSGAEFRTLPAQSRLRAAEKREARRQRHANLRRAPGQESEEHWRGGIGERGLFEKDPFKPQRGVPAHQGHYRARFCPEVSGSNAALPSPAQTFWPIADAAGEVNHAKPQIDPIGAKIGWQQVSSSAGDRARRF